MMRQRVAFVFKNGKIYFDDFGVAKFKMPTQPAGSNQQRKDIAEGD